MSYGTGRFEDTRPEERQGDGEKALSAKGSFTPGNTLVVGSGGAAEDSGSAPASPQVNSDWNANSGVAQILNKPTIPTVPGYASQAEAEAGVENTKIMTPLRVAQAIDAQGATTKVYEPLADADGRLILSASREVILVEITL